ncbi:MAG TPA: hypothetical protein VFY10_01885 [Dehalococcoidia bacterium]|nr:hypothetical protein [Dehalococcoidia bacterium]
MNETIDHATIRDWAERYGGKPQVWDNPQAGSDRLGVRIDFPGSADDAFNETPNQPRDISWEQFFLLFDELNLAFEYEDRNGVADRSQLYRFTRRPPDE